MSGVISACTDHIEPDVAPALPGENVYFSNDEGNVLSIGENATELTVNVYRVTEKGNQTVNISGSVTDENGTVVEGVFTIPSQVTFESETDVTPLAIGVDFAKVEPEVAYVINLKIDGKDMTPYGPTSKMYIASYAPWTPFERYGGKDEYGTITLSAFSISGKEVAVYTSRSLIKPEEKYQFGDAYCDDLQEDENLWTWSINGYNFLVTRSTEAVSAKYPTLFACTMEPCPTGDDESFGEMLMVTDAYTYVSQINPNAIPDGATAENFRNMSVYDSETGLFEMSIIYYTSEGILAQRDEYFQLPGFANYSVEFNYTGNFVDAKGNELAIVQAYKSDDVNSYTYALKSGKLTEEEVDAVAEELANDEEAELNYDTTTNLSFSLNEEGDYTIVAVGYDESGKQVLTTSYSFTFASVQVNNPWTNLGLVEYTDGFFCMALKPEYCNETMEVELLQSKETSGLYRLKNPYMEWSVNQENGYTMIESGSYIEFNIQNPNCVYITDSPLGLTLDANGQLCGYSYAAFLLENGKTQQDIIQAGYAGKLEHGVITFPAGTLLGYFENDPEQGLYYANLDPKNPTSGQNFDPFWGTGKFCIDMSNIMNGQALSPKKHVAGKAVNGMIAANLKSNGNAVASGFKMKNVKSKKSNKISGMELLKNNTVKAQKLRLR